MANRIQIPQDLLVRINHLNSQLEYVEAKPKCEWPLDHMAEIHAVSNEITDIVGKELHAAMKWPDAEHSHPEAFYPGPMNRNPDFKRPKTGWLEQQGYSMQKTTYTYGDRWDRVPITAAFYVPDNLQAGDEARIMWYFHGGGYCTGANDFIPWISKASLSHAHRHKAIIIAPDYPLGPEANYPDIVSSIKDFLTFYKHDTSFEPSHSKWTAWLLAKIPIENVTLNTTRILVEGESAGGLAAATALFLNADKKTGAKIDVAVALLRYPMIEHYARRVHEYVYMGATYAAAAIDAKAEEIQRAVAALEESGFLPTRVRSAPPQHMCAAFVLSVTGRWKGSFQRAHKGQEMGDPFDVMDGLERARRSVDRVDHALLPPVYMYHGDRDGNCRVEKTLEFERILRERYGGRYHDGTIRTRVVEGMGHGFDYELELEGNKFLRETFADIDRHW